MKSVGNNIWVVETGFKLYGAELGNRMTVIRLSNHELLLHSPIKLNDEIREKVDSLGKVTYIITPNHFHGLYSKEWSLAFPSANYYTAKHDEVAEKTGLPIEELSRRISDQELKIVRLAGAPKVNEYAFYHAKSRILVLTDIAFNIAGPVKKWTILFFTLNSAYNKFGPSRIMKTMISSKTELQESINSLLDFDFKKIIVSHGNIVEENAKEMLRIAFFDSPEKRSKLALPKISMSRCG